MFNPRISLAVTALSLIALAGCAHNKCNSKCESGYENKCGRETSVSMSQLPAVVQATLARESAGGKVEEIKKEIENGKTTYSAEVELNGKDWELTIAEDGTVIEKEME